MLFAREPGWEFSLMLGLLAIFLFIAVPALSVGESERELVTVLQFVLASVAIALLARSPWLRAALAADAFVPDAFNGLTAATPYRTSQVIHFSIATMSTVGDGTKLPHSPFARSLADLRTIIGQLFPAILLSRLAGLHVSGSQGQALNLTCGTCLKRYIAPMAWRVVFFDDDVRAKLDGFPADIRARFLRISRLIEAGGVHTLREPYVKHLEGPVWEMRMRGRDGIARAAYVIASGERVVVVHVFAKKTQKTPRREIETALKRATEVR